MLGFKNKKKLNIGGVSPNEIFLDSENIPDFDSHQFEGRMERPIKSKNFLFVVLIFLMFGSLLISKIGYLQIIKGDDFYARAENNHLRLEPLVSERGCVYDRNEELLAWNEPFSRVYKKMEGMAHVLGYTGLSFGERIGKAGIEKSYNEYLGGVSGIKLVETDSRNQIKSESIQRRPTKGGSIYLSIDSRVQAKFYEIFSDIVEEKGFNGAAGIIMDAKNGEILSLVNYPEYDLQVLSDGKPREMIEEYLSDDRKPFLNRSVSGLYTPGSTIKPFLALAALVEGIISPEKEIFSSGSISIPNPYYSDRESIFHDWKAHHWVDMRKAIAVSSNIYFYTIGGGYEDVVGLGIKRISKHLKFFGLGEKTGIDLRGELAGVVPNPDSSWRVGDTYNVSIGQGDLQVTPIQMAILTAFLANNGNFVTPSLVLNKEDVDNEDNTGLTGIDPEYFKIVKEGMRKAVLEGTASALKSLSVEMAAKTGTAELGNSEFVNSWLIGFWPAEDPRFVLTIMLEKGPSSNLVGGVFVARKLMEWMIVYTPEYLSLSDNGFD